MEEEKTEKINSIHEIINGDLKTTYSVLGLDYEKMMREKEEKENPKPKEEKIHYGHSSPYGLTSDEELEEISKTNPSLYAALINWN